MTQSRKEFDTSASSFPLWFSLSAKPLWGIGGVIEDILDADEA